MFIPNPNNLYNFFSVSFAASNERDWADTSAHFTCTIQKKYEISTVNSRLQTAVSKAYRSHDTLGKSRNHFINS